MRYILFLLNASCLQWQKISQWCFEVNIEDIVKLRALNTCSHKPLETLNYQNVRAFFGRDITPVPFV